MVASPTDVFSLVGLGLSVDLRARLSRPLSPLASPGSGSATSWGSSLASMQAGVSEVRGGRAPSMDATLEEPLRPAGTSRVYVLVMASPPSCYSPSFVWISATQNGDGPGGAASRVPNTCPCGVDVPSGGGGWCSVMPPLRRGALRLAGGTVLMNPLCASSLMALSIAVIGSRLDANSSARVTTVPGGLVSVNAKMPLAAKLKVGSLMTPFSSRRLMATPGLRWPITAPTRSEHRPPRQ